MAPAKPVRAELSYLALEPRIAFDAAAAATVADASHHADAPADVQAAAAPTPDLVKDLSVAMGTTEPAQSVDAATAVSPQTAVSAPEVEPDRRRELVFIGSDIGNVQEWLDDLNKNSDSTRQLEVVTLSANRDGLEQITEILAGRNDVSAIHVMSHGVAGAIKLGDIWLTQGNLGQYQSLLGSWQAALSEDADILFYGCDVASDSRGQQLLLGISELTGADVNASTDNTGNVLYGGDWNLEYATGLIETRLALSEELQAHWMGLLNATVDATSNGAITGANSLTISHTTSGIDRLMLVTIAIDPHGTNTTSVTYGGVNLTFIGAAYGGGHSRAELWALLAPNTGTDDVVVTFSGTGYHGVVAGVVTFTGVDQNSPYANFATTSGRSANASVTVGSSSDDLVFAAVHVHDGAGSVTQGAGQTEHWDNKIHKSTSAGSTEAGAPSVLNSWSVRNDDWTAIGISIQSTHAGPIIQNLGGDELRYTVGGGPVVIDQGTASVVTDPSSPDFDTGSLTVSLISGSDASEDILSIRNQGTGAGQIGVSGANVTYGGVTIGTFAGGTGGANLVITFNANATPAAAAALIQNIAFENTDAASPTLGTRTVRFVLADGDGGISSNYDTMVTLNPVLQSVKFWLSSTGNATASSGLTWSDSSVVQFGDPDVAVEPGTTGGTFSEMFELSLFAGDGDAQLRGLYLVRSDITVGSGVNSIALQAGDVLFSTADDETFGGVAGTNRDLWLFRPTAPDDYSAGTFSILLNSPTGNQMRDITLVEAPITVGGVALNAGDFLIVQDTATYEKDIWRFQATDVGDGTTAGTFTQFIDGADIGLDAAIGGMEFINDNVVLGNRTLQAGQIVLSLLADDMVGNNSLAVTRFDLFVLDVTQAGATSTATASLLFEGADVGLDAAGEEFDALAIVDVNRAPVLSGADNLAAILEDSSNNSGTLVSTLISGHVIDADNAALTGIAVIDVDNTNGSWEWSSNAGVSWNSFGTPDAMNARLLAADANTYVRFVPNADYTGAVVNGITFHAWDQTVGTPGQTADTSVNGGSTAFSAASASSGITVTAVNDAPVLDVSKTPVLATQNEDSGLPSGAVGTLISSLIDFASPAGQVDNVTDVDSAAVTGIAVIAADTTNGTWYYTTDGGSNWNALGAVSNNSARLLAADANTRLYFEPNANYNGTIANAIAFRAWDQTSGANGALVDASTNGGTTAFSSASDLAVITINPGNDAPVLADTALSLTVAEDAGVPVGAVGAIVGSFTGGISDIDAAAVRGIALVGSDETRGVWYFSTNGGSNWSAVGSVSTASSLLLADDGNTRLYFAPSADYNGPAAAALTIRAWDQTSGANGAVADTSSNGGTTAFSSATDVVDVTVTAVNDAPVLDVSKTPVLATQNEDAGGPSGAVGTLISSLVDFAAPAGQVDNLTDVDSGAAAGIAVIAADTTNGTWFYTTDGGSNWNALGAVSDNSARLLAADVSTRLYFQSNADYNGTTANAIAFRAWDRTSGANGGLADTSINGGTTAFSSASDFAVITINAINDAPTISAGTTVMLPTTAENAPSVGTTVESILISAVWRDVDSSAIQGIAITAVSGNGTWQYSTDGATWTDFGNVSTVHALLITASTAVRYVPVDVGDGTARFTFVAWDQTTSLASDNDVPRYGDPSGGSSAFSGQTAYAELQITAAPVPLPPPRPPAIDPPAPEPEPTPDSLPPIMGNVEPISLSPTIERMQRLTDAPVLLMNETRDIVVIIKKEDIGPRPLLADTEQTVHEEAKVADATPLPSSISPNRPWNVTGEPLLVNFTHVAFLEDLDRQLADLRDTGNTVQTVLTQIMAGSSIAVSAGYVAWVLRGGSLMSALLSTMPVWQTFDPMILVKPKSRDKKRQDESQVERMFDGAARSQDTALGAI